jgi:hypothetical protein
MLKMINWKSEQIHTLDEQGSRIPFTCLVSEAPKYNEFSKLYKRTLGQVHCHLKTSLHSKMNVILGSQREKCILPV